MLQLIIAGLSNGCTYAILAMALTLLFRMSNILNLAQGEFLTIGGIFPVWAAAHWGVGAGLALLVAIAACVVLGFVSARVSLVPALRRGAPVVELLSITIALALLLEGVSYWIFGDDIYYAKALLPGSESLRLGNIGVAKETLLLLGVALVVGAGLSIVLKRTGIGWLLRACADSGYSIRMLGADVPMLTAVTFAFAAGLSCIAGFLVAPLVPFSYLTGFGYMLQALVGCALVNFRSPLLAGLAGMAVGIVQALVAGYISAGYQSVITFGLLAAVLLARPSHLRVASEA